MNEASQPIFKLSIPVRRINTALKWVAIINLVFLAGTWVHHSRIIMPEKKSMQLMLAQFSLSLENVTAAWYSSMLLFLIAVTALVCFWADVKRATDAKQKIMNYGWLIITGIFLTLSFDEMGSFHEMIGETQLFKKTGSAYNSGWIAFYALIGVVAIFMITFFLVKFKNNKRALLFTVLGILLFVSNPFQEKFEIHTWREAADPGNWRRPSFFLLLEEGSELFAAFCFLYSLITYAIEAAPGYNIARSRLLLLESKFSKNITLHIAGLAFFLGMIMLIIHLNAWNFVRDDNGIPHNWPPSATAFFSAIAALYLYFKFDHNKNRELYLLIAFTSFIISIYFGANIYGYTKGFFFHLRYAMLALAVITAWFSLTRFNYLFTKVFIIAWILLMIMSVFTSRFYPAAFGYLGSVAMLLALILCYKNIMKNMSVATDIATPL